MKRRIACKVQSKGCLTDRRPGSKNDQIGILPAIGDVIQGSITAGHARDVFILMTKIFDTLDCFHQHRIDGIKIPAKVIVRYFKQLAFSVIE